MDEEMHDAVTFSIQRSKAGTVKRIRLENFMCHSNLEIELGEWVNFITGQNGSKASLLEECTKNEFLDYSGVYSHWGFP